MNNRLRRIRILGREPARRNSGGLQSDRFRPVDGVYGHSFIKGAALRFLKKVLKRQGSLKPRDGWPTRLKTPRRLASERVGVEGL